MLYVSTCSKFCFARRWERALCYLSSAMCKQSVRALHALAGSSPCMASVSGMGNVDSLQVQEEDS